MRNKFLAAGDPGYHPLRKIQVIMDGIRFGFACITVAYKLVLSTILLVLSFHFHDWIDVMVILVATAQVLAGGGLFSTAIETVCDFCETARLSRIYQQQQWESVYGLGQ